jgi:hypothetical protein
LRRRARARFDFQHLRLATLMGALEHCNGMGTHGGRLLLNMAG